MTTPQLLFLRSTGEVWDQEYYERGVPRIDRRGCCIGALLCCCCCGLINDFETEDKLDVEYQLCYLESLMSPHPHPLFSEIRMNAPRSHRELVMGIAGRNLRDLRKHVQKWTMTDDHAPKLEAVRYFTRWLATGWWSSPSMALLAYKLGMTRPPPSAPPDLRAAMLGLELLCLKFDSSRLMKHLSDDLTSRVTST